MFKTLSCLHLRSESSEQNSSDSDQGRTEGRHQEQPCLSPECSVICIAGADSRVILGLLPTRRLSKAENVPSMNEVSYTVCMIRTTVWASPLLKLQFIHWLVMFPNLNFFLSSCSDDWISLALLIVYSLFTYIMGIGYIVLFNVMYFQTILLLYIWRELMVRKAPSALSLLKRRLWI